MLQDCLKTIWETATRHEKQTLVDGKRAYWIMVHIRIGYHKLALRILGLQAVAVLLE